MPPPPERRYSGRLKLKVPVEIYIEGAGSRYRGATSDISMLGCYIESMFPFPVGTQVELKLDITSTLLVLGEVVTSDPQVGNGIQFVRMLPEDIAELRAFLESAEKEFTDAAGEAN